MNGSLKNEFTVLIEENPEIVEIFEMYFQQLHKIDLVVVGLDHFLLESNPQHSYKHNHSSFLPVVVVLLIVFSLVVLRVIYFLISVSDSKTNHSLNTRIFFVLQ